MGKKCIGFTPILSLFKENVLNIFTYISSEIGWIWTKLAKGWGRKRANLSNFWRDCFRGPGERGQNLTTHFPLLVFTTRKPSCCWQTCATLAKSFHGLRKSSGVVSCITSLPIDSVPIVSYYVLYSNCVCKMCRFGDTRLLKLPWPWNPGQGSFKVIETDTIW